MAVIEKIMCGVEESTQKTMVILMSEKTLHPFWKNTNVANNDYNSQYDAYVTVLDAYAGGITVPTALVYGKLKELYPSLSNPENAL